MLHRAHPILSSLIYGLLRTRSGAHRIRLQVSGGAHPRYGRNLGTPEPFATNTRLQASDRTVVHDAQHPSAVWLPVYG
jgi:predicted acyl esterase